MDSVQEFASMHTDTKDPVRPLLNELSKRQRSLAESRIELIQFLAPVRGKHGWDVTLIDSPEVEAAAGKIEVAEGMLAETRADILDYARLQGEIDTIEKAQAKVRHLRSVKEGTSGTYKAILLAAVEDHVGEDLSEISQIPRVMKAKARLQQAEAELAKAEAELKPIIANLDDLRQKAAVILAKYH